MSAPLPITGLGALSALGPDLDAHRSALASARCGLRPLAELRSDLDLGELHVGWIEPRSLLRDRKWSPLSMAALHVARQALDAAGWSDAERADTTVFFGTSRGTLSGWLDPWPDRRAFDLFAATNSLPAEPAAAVCTQFGLGGSWRVSSTGCCAGLDALADAELWIRSGRIPRALVIAADLPLVPALLDAYARTGLLAQDGAPGMQPAEAAAALCLEAPSATAGGPRLVGCDASANPRALLSSSTTDPPLDAMFRRACERHGPPAQVILHGSGTRRNAELEATLLKLAPEAVALRYKPWTGHAVAASGLLEVVLAAAQIFPPSPPVAAGSHCFKLASALGGRHSLACIHHDPPIH